MIKLPIGICDICGARSEVIHFQNQLVSPTHLSSRELAGEIERLWAVVSAQADIVNYVAEAKEKDGRQ